MSARAENCPCNQPLRGDMLASFRLDGDVDDVCLSFKLLKIFVQRNATMLDDAGFVSTGLKSLAGRVQTKF